MIRLIFTLAIIYYLYLLDRFNEVLTKRTMKHILPLFVLVLFFSSCTKNDTPNYHLEALPIESAVIPDTLKLNNVYDIKVNYNLPNSAHSFYSLYFAHKDKERIMYIVSYVNDDMSATGPTIKQDYTFPLTVAQKEKYIFKLWKGKTNNKDVYDSIIVPVIDPSQK